MMESFFESDTGRKLVFDGENWVERHTIDPGIDINGGSVINAATVTPSDTTDLDAPSKWLYIGVSGDLEVILTGGPNGHIPQPCRGILPYLCYTDQGGRNDRTKHHSGVVGYAKRKCAGLTV